MEKASDVEIDLKVQELIKTFQLCGSCFSNSCSRFYEAYENPKMSAQIDAAIDRKVRGLMEKIYIARDVLENSAFYREFLDQMQDSEMLARIERVRGTDPDHSHLQMVFYGIGHIDPESSCCGSSSGLSCFENGQIQLAFAILLKEKFGLVNDIEVYDPLISPMERQAITQLGCTVLEVNENGKRTVDRPTLFFMPYCPIHLLENVLDANWTPANLNKIIIIFYSFHRFKLRKALGLTKLMTVKYSDRLRHEVPLPRTAVREIGPPVSRARPGVFGESFKNLSWHFFAWDGSSEDLNKLEEPYLLN